MTRRRLLQGAATGLVFSRGLARTMPRPIQSVRDEDLAYATLSDAAEWIRTRQLSPVELARSIFQRIDLVESKVNGFITVTRESALRAASRAAQEIAQGRYRGPLHGIPVGLKDNEYTQGVRTTAASPMLADFVPAYDSTVAARLKRAGAVIVGKTALPEFSFGGHTPGTHNPWDLSRTAGGSSGGSGAALAAGMLIGATGGDTSGSIRNPAATNGIVGFKPTYGRVSLYGIVPIAWSLDHVGPMTRTVEDNALMLNILAGHDPLDPKSSQAPVPDYRETLRKGVRGMRMGFPADHWFDGYHPDVMTAFEGALRFFSDAGAVVREVEMPSSTDVSSDAQRIIRICEAASYHDQFLRRNPDGYGASNVRRDVEAASLIPAAHYLRAQRVRSVFIREMSDLFKDLDVFLTPGKPDPAGVEVSVRQTFRPMFNLLGFPAMVLPSGFTTSPPGLPVGLQIAASPFEEQQIFRAAFAYESETKWYERHPEIS